MRKAETLEQWVNKLTAKTNEKFEGVANLTSHIKYVSGYSVDGMDQYGGWVHVNVDLDSDAGSKTNNGDSRRAYVQELRKQFFSIKKGVFIDESVDGGEHITISFRDNSEEAMYALTPAKKRTINYGFKRIEEFVEFYSKSKKPEESSETVERAYSVLRQ